MLSKNDAMIASGYWSMVKNGDVSDRDIDDVTYKILYTYINRMGGKKEIGKMMANEHPTLQQSFMREVVMSFINEMASKEYMDMRNEASVNACKAIKKILDEIYFPFV